MDESNINSILDYYLFQKSIEKLTKGIYEKEEAKLSKGYLVSSSVINLWKGDIKFNMISEYLDSNDIYSKKRKKQTSIIKDYIKKNKIQISNHKNFSNFIFPSPRLFTKDYFGNFINKNIFNIPDKLKDKHYVEVEYIFKKNMIIILFDKFNSIKIFFYYEKKSELINLTFMFDEKIYYDKYHNFFEKKNSNKILNFILTGLTINIILWPVSAIEESNFEIACKVYNEELYYQIEKENNINNNQKNINKLNNKINLKGIIEPHNINYTLIDIVSYRGLDNVGATCYMNATLQCLANIRPITKYLLNPNNYSILFDNKISCLMTMEYIQVLIGLFCNDSRDGSYCPKQFKDKISEYNPLFKGVQANDSKDLIIFLLEIINNELVQIHNIKQKEKNGNNAEEKILYEQIDPSNETKVLKLFISEYQKTHCSVIGTYLCGFQKSIFLCQNCGCKSINFNIFNFLIFSLEATSNYFNLSFNNTIVPIINFDYCFKFLSKEEIFQNTYCQFCNQIGNSNYRDYLYSMPIYLIIILNRGKGNIFNCNVQIPEKFCPSDYVENDKNDIYNLIGIVSHFGESGMGGHFIAFCKHSIDGKWRCYNDSIVTECKNDYLQKGTPYILFYKKQLNNSNNVISEVNTINSNNIINNQNNNMNSGQQLNIIFNNNYPNMNNNFQQNMTNDNNIYQQNYYNMNMNINNIQQMNNNCQGNVFLNNYNFNNNFQQNTIKNTQRNIVSDNNFNNIIQQNMNNSSQFNIVSSNNFNNNIQQNMNNNIQGNIDSNNNYINNQQNINNNIQGNMFLNNSFNNFQQNININIQDNIISNNNIQRNMNNNMLDNNISNNNYNNNFQQNMNNMQDNNILNTNYNNNFQQNMNNNIIIPNNNFNNIEDSNINLNNNNFQMNYQDINDKFNNEENYQKNANINNLQQNI